MLMGCKQKQWSVIVFLTKEGRRLLNIHKRPLNIYGNDTMAKKQCFQIDGWRCLNYLNQCSRQITQWQIIDYNHWHESCELRNRFSRKDESQEILSNSLLEKNALVCNAEPKAEIYDNLSLAPNRKIQLVEERGEEPKTNDQPKEHKSPTNFAEAVKTAT